MGERWKAILGRWGRKVGEEKGGGGEHLESVE